MTTELERIYAKEFSSPLGELYLLSTAEGILAVGLPNYDRTKINKWAQVAVQGLVQDGPHEHLQLAEQELVEYFTGTRKVFTVPLDWRLAQGFGGLVCQAVNRIPYGKTCSYGEIAERVGKPGGAQAVGQACGRNPLPLLVPCHRVLASGKGIGGYGGGIEAKKFLLSHEKIEFFS